MQGRSTGLPGSAAAQGRRARPWSGRRIGHFHAAPLRRQRASAKHGAVRAHPLLWNPPTRNTGERLPTTSHNVRGNLELQSRSSYCPLDITCIQFQRRNTSEHILIHKRDAPLVINYFQQDTFLIRFKPTSEQWSRHLRSSHYTCLWSETM